YAGLSQAFELMPYFSATPSDSVFDRAVKAAQFALSRDSTLAEAHMSLGLAYMHGRRWADAKTEFERGVAVDPSDVQTHFHFGRFYYYMGEPDKALAEWRRARQLDPFSALAAGWTGMLLSQTGHISEGIA